MVKNYLSSIIHHEIRQMRYLEFKFIPFYKIHIHTQIEEYTHIQKRKFNIVNVYRPPNSICFDEHILM